MTVLEHSFGSYILVNIAYRIRSTDNQLKGQICCFLLRGKAGPIGRSKNGGKKSVGHDFPSETGIFDSLHNGI